MTYKTIISTDDAYQHLHDPGWLFFDCRYYLEKPQQGEAEYAQSHIPRALYAHLDKDLSSSVVPGETGRHPLPEVNALCNLFSRWGVDETVQVVVYDQGPGMIAARLWWMLRWLGHDAVAVMDGGWKKWLEDAKPVSEEVAVASARHFTARVREAIVAGVDDVLASMADANVALLDARATDRFRGENETLDPVAGHIPGALCVPYMNHVDQQGCFRSAAELRDMYTRLLVDMQVSDAIVYCGSGVTAGLNILALSYAGLGMARLYAGSWSHWITDESRPVETDN
jgi:thiosulfate/3-mercaptopyruvate sulfurtransferase